jgi:ribosome maturation protein SDO1
MTQTTARLKHSGKNFEIMVDLDKALSYKKGEGVTDSREFLEIDQIFKDHKKGEKASESDLKNSFGTEDVYDIAGQIVKKGEVLLTQEHRDDEREQKIKQVVDFLVANSVDPSSGRPHTAERIKSALSEAQVHIKNTPIDQQASEIVEKISAVLPIKIETKRVKITVPAMHTGKVYGVLSPYNKEKEKWLDDGSLEVVIDVPAGLIMEFYDKLNSITHGSALTEDLKTVEDEEKGKE